MKNHCTSVILLLLSALLFLGAHTQEGSVRASLTVTPGPADGIVPVSESIGSIEACVVLSAEPTANVVITLQTTDSNARAGSDYGSESQELVFTPSPVLTQCVNITIIQDGAVENTFEFFFVQASTSSSNVTGLPASRLISIEDADQITIGLVQATYSIQEAPESATLEVCAEILQGSVQRPAPVIVTFGAQDGLTDSSDYTLVGTMGSFLTGDTQVCTNFSILADNRVEGTESFTVTLTGPSNEVEVSSTAGSATVEIIDDDGATVSLQSVSPVLEPGNSGDSTTTVDVCVSVVSAPGPIDRIVITFNTVEGTADSGDFQPLDNQMLTTPPTSVGSSVCQSVTIQGDTVVEDIELFSVTASVATPNTITSSDTAIVTIIDDDGATVSLQSVSSVSEPGDNGGDTTVDVCATLDSAPGPIVRDIVITFNTVPGTTDSGDLQPLSNQTLTIPSTTPVGNSVCQPVTILGDTAVEDDETFTIIASVASPDIITPPAAVDVTIMDDDGMSVSLQSASLDVTEPGDNGDSTTVDVCVVINSVPAGPIDRVGGIVVTFNTVPGTADSGDFQPLSNRMLTVPPTTPVGSPVCQPVTILGDIADEDDETFSIRASVASPDTITSPDSVTVTIMDDNDVVQCDGLANPLSGSVSLPSGRSVGSTASYVCNGGFILNGASTRTCEENGQWSGSEPTCVAEGGIGQRQDDDNRVVIITVPTVVGGVILIVVIIVFIVLIAAYFNKKKTSHKYVLNYHTVYGNQQNKSTSVGEIATSSPQNDDGESGDPSDGSGDIVGQEKTETAETFKSSQQSETSIVNEDADINN